MKNDNSNSTSFSEILDSLRAESGCKIIDILDNCDMLKKVLTKPSQYLNIYILEVIDKSFGLNIYERILALPYNLPIMVKPSSKNVLAGYLVNDDKFSENLFIENKLSIIQ